jgi:uncharacterized protein (TIGR02246 family)
LKTDLEKQLPALARQPEDCGPLLLAALEAGDLEASVALYEVGAVLFRKSGTVMTGLDAIRESNALLIDLKPKFTIEFIKTAINADGTLATSRMKANLTAAGKDGQTIHSVIHTLEVVRKQADGSWRFVIDDPYGSMREGMKEK